MADTSARVTRYSMPERELNMAQFVNDPVQRGCMHTMTTSITSNQFLIHWSVSTHIMQRSIKYQTVILNLTAPAWSSVVGSCQNPQAVASQRVAFEAHQPPQMGKDTSEVPQRTVQEYLVRY